MVASSSLCLMPAPETTALPRVRERSRRAARIHRAARRPVSLFQRRLAAGEAVVSADGNLAAGYLAAKRAMDIAGALVLLTLLAPVMLVVFVVLMITTRGKPIFRQVRLGWQGRPFVMYKFRTMIVDAEKRRGEVANEQAGPVFKNRRDWRVTRFGRLLRRTSLDETPQLLNVLAGQMSLVGPRPPLAHEVARYKPWQRRRLAVRPGLTCFWQVGGRSEIAFDDWARLDLRYIRLQSLRTDLGLLLATPRSVLTGRGAY
jgi:lipopolysaccharide/colanic/teichoic acid biosynthesis glycosyltransferase